MSEREPFSVQIKVRHYELDTLGHLNHAVYHQYAEVARLEMIEASGALAGLRDDNIAAVLLESTVRFKRELRAGDTVTVTCDGRFGEGKVFRLDSLIVKADGTVSAEIDCTLGLMDLDRRKLVPDVRGVLERAGADLKLMSTAE